MDHRRRVLFAMSLIGLGLVDPYRRDHGAVVRGDRFFTTSAALTALISDQVPVFQRAASISGVLVSGAAAVGVIAGWRSCRRSLLSYLPAYLGVRGFARRVVVPLLHLDMLPSTPAPDG